MNKTQDNNKNILTVPNILSILRLCMIPFLVWLYCFEKNYMLTLFVLILSGVTDVADGYIARHFNMTSDFGKILDPIADKLTQTVMFACLVTRFTLMALPLSLMIIKEFIMGITGCMVIHKTGKVHSAVWHGKMNTCLLYAMMALHVIWFDIPAPVSNVTIAVCTVMMAISLILYGTDNIKSLRSAANKEKKRNGSKEK